MSVICKSIQLAAIPYLGIYNTDYYKILETTVLSNSVSAMPEKLQDQLASLECSSIEFLTISHNGRFLSQIGDTVELNLLFQPYIFYDSEVGDNVGTTINLGVYTDNSAIINVNLNNHIKDSVAINPDDITKCSLFTCIHPDKNDMCLSPNNGKIKISTYIPLYAFYSMILVPYNKKIARVLVTKHVLVIDTQVVKELNWPEYFVCDEFQLEMIGEAIERLGGHQGWIWYLHYLTWKISGSPNIGNYGAGEWEKLTNSFYELGFEDEKIKIKEIFNKFIEDLIVWKNYVKDYVDL